MNFKRINWGLSIIVIASLTTFLLTRKKEFKDDNFQYGKDFNQTRDSLGIPKIESDWIAHESTLTTWYWANRDKRVTTIEPIHLYKISNLNGDKLTDESDGFHFETGDSLAFRVIFKFNFDNSTWDNKIIKYRKGKYPPTYTWNLTLEQADSTINKWGLRR